MIKSALSLALLFSATTAFAYTPNPECQEVSCDPIQIPPPPSPDASVDDLLAYCQATGIALDDCYQRFENRFRTEPRYYPEGSDVPAAVDAGSLEQAYPQQEY